MKGGFTLNHKLSKQSEKIVIFDLMTYAWRSFSLVRDISDIVRNPSSPDIPIKKFYHDWCEKKLESHEDPFNPGLILMISYATIVLGKEKWVDIIPNIPVSKSDPKWGLRQGIYEYPNKEDPSIRDIIIRIRNAISHATINLITGEGAGFVEFLKNSYFILKDEPARFQAKISVWDLYILNNTLRNELYDHLSSLNK